MSVVLPLALAQLNVAVGAVAENCGKIRAARSAAAAQGAAVLATSELAVSGCPPEDLASRPAFLQDAFEAVAALARDTADGGPALIVGAPWRSEAGPVNALLVLDGGGVQDVVCKRRPSSCQRWADSGVFVPGPPSSPILVRGMRLGLMIGEDLEHEDAARSLAQAGAERLLVAGASAFRGDAAADRLIHARRRVAETGLPLAWINQIGGQDELVFDGGSFALDADSALSLQLPRWKEALRLAWDRRSPLETGIGAETGDGAKTGDGAETGDDPLENLYQGMMLGLHDYVVKNGFPGVVLGLSGGIDSALSAAVAVDALGPERVWAVMMPSPYTSRESLEDAERIARMLGIRFDSLAIAPATDAFSSMLSPLLDGPPCGVTAENLQARVRGLALMAISNAFGHMVLSTGNKSELSVGYATLYGDMCGGYSVLKDVYKTRVFALARWRNLRRPAGAQGPEGSVMPERVVVKAPSAELRPDQKDEDTLPPYAILDAVLERLIEREASLADVVAEGYPEKIVFQIWRMLNKAEYKRRQAPPGAVLAARSLGRDRHYPMTNADPSLSRQESLV